VVLTDINPGQLPTDGDHVIAWHHVHDQHKPPALVLLARSDGEISHVTGDNEAKGIRSRLTKASGIATHHLHVGLINTRTDRHASVSRKRSRSMLARVLYV
jgi:hypothetical protein